MIILTSSTGRIEYANRAANQKLGYEETQGMIFFDMFADYDRYHMKASLTNLMRDQDRGTVKFDKPMEIHRRTGLKDLLIDVVAHCDKSKDDDGGGQLWSVVFALRPART